MQKKYEDLVNETKILQELQQSDMHDLLTVKNNKNTLSNTSCKRIPTLDLIKSFCLWNSQQVIE